MNPSQSPDKPAVRQLTVQGAQPAHLLLGLVWIVGALALIAGIIYLMWPWLHPLLMRFYD